ncbi:MAG: hypothetical protein AAFZ11_00805 [Pseudomonadota bacterium]
MREPEENLTWFDIFLIALFVTVCGISMGNALCAALEKGGLL